MRAEVIKVLLLEDSPSDTFLVCEELSVPAIWGAFNVEHVETLADALAVLATAEFDAIVLDLNLPDSDGFETFTRLYGAVPDTAVIVLSGQDDELLATRAVKAGAQDYVVKGQGGLLPRVVRYAVERTRAQVERRKLEEQFVQAHKMEMVGRLSAGVAHDFNNILSVIMGYNDLMLSRFDPEDSMRNHAEEIQHAAERAAALTRQLLIFSRQETLEPSILNVNDVIRGMDKMLRRLAGEDIEFVLHLEDRIGRIHADSGFIGQILMNLVVNARDAMPNGGKLRIETAQMKIGAGATATAGSFSRPVPGSYAVLSVIDTGCGMTDAVRSRIFEAFFTTKDKDQGTGLGLAICQNIVEQSGGHISVESEPGRGATFRIFFPLVDREIEAVNTGPDRPLPGGNETVLVVEDEPAVRHLTSTILGEMGYTVLMASNGEEGLRVAEDHSGEPIRLVLTDVVMPRMGGRTMAESLRCVDPDIKIVFTSGYAEKVAAQRHWKDDDVAFLPKPYTPDSLTRKVRETLNGR
jgi:signal transduction histidine kinase